jgi:hypothetical protein
MKKFITAVITSGIMLAPVAAFAADIVMQGSVSMEGSVSMDDNLSVKGGFKGIKYATVVRDDNLSLKWSNHVDNHTNIGLILVDNGTVQLPPPSTSSQVITVIGVNNSAISTRPGITLLGGLQNNTNASVECVSLDNATWACF